MRRLAVVGLVLAGVVAATVLGGVFGPGPATVPAANPPQLTAVDLLEQRITTTQERLRRVPGDWSAWAGLGMAYLEHARITSDPTYYPKAEAAVAKSFEVRPEANTEALVARGALANARHDFAAASRDAEAAIDTNAYHADAYAVLADARTQLGDAAAATAAIQRLLDLRPGLSGYARASYDLELRGQTTAAADLMRRALAAAIDRADIAFCHIQLGDLAWNSGDLMTAGTEYTAALAADPTSIPALRGQARLAAAAGHTADALGAYANLTRRAPAPAYLLEYAQLLRLAARDAEASAQLALADQAYRLFTGNGGIDGLTGAALGEATGHPADALAEARAEFGRRQHADVIDSLAWALHLSHLDDQALPYAERALAGGARSASYSYHLGMIRLALGDRAGAREALTAALAINPAFSVTDAPAARQALATIQNGDSQ
jgi:tetratricopeptide (TPR) repeat protein